MLKPFVDQTRSGLARQLLQFLPAIVNHVDAVGHAVRTAGAAVAETLAAGALVTRTAAGLITDAIRGNARIATVWRCQLKFDGVHMSAGHNVVLEKAVPALVEREVDEEEMHLHKDNVHVANENR